MAGPDPASHVLLLTLQNVVGRVEPGYDDISLFALSRRAITRRHA